VTLIYHPFKEELYDDFNDTLVDLLKKAPDKATLLLAHDINANVGVRGESGEFDDVLGPFGIDNWNDKGAAALNFLQSLKLRVMNTYYNHPHYCTWSNKATGTSHMLDVWTTNHSHLFADCRVWNNHGIVGSDHSATIAKIALSTIKIQPDERVSAGITDWKEIRDNPVKNREFNDNLRSLTNPLTCYTDYNAAILKAGEMTAVKTKRMRRGWFELSRDSLQPLCDAKNKAMHNVRSVPEAIKPMWKQRVKELTKSVREQVEIAKTKWISAMAEKINSLNVSPKEAWQCLREVEDGVGGHHTKPITMRMRLENGKLANNDRDNMKVFSKHLQKVYNQRRPIYADAAKLIAQREIMQEIGESISWEEFNKAVMKLTNDKSPGENGVPPNAFKCLDDENKQAVHQYICDFWDGEMDYEDWHTGLVKLLPKSGNLIATQTSGEGSL
jgi:hypothetical protein